MIKPSLLSDNFYGIRKDMCSFDVWIGKQRILGIYRNYQFALLQFVALLIWNHISCDKCLTTASFAYLNKKEF